MKEYLTRRKIPPCYTPFKRIICKFGKRQIVIVYGMYRDIPKTKSMKTYQIQLLEPKAEKLLEELVKLKLISIQEMPSQKQRFVALLAKVRQKDLAPLHLAEITKEVEIVRKKGYKKSDENSSNS